MKQSEIVDVYKVLCKLSQQSLPLTTAYKLFKLREQIKPAWDFQVEEEQKLIDAYKPEAVGNGELKFRSPEERAQFEKKVSEILAMDSGIEIEPVCLPLTDDITLSATDIQAIAPVIAFQ